MILKAKERGDAAQLARYLLATRENDHVELHEVSGFASGDLIEAFREADAIAKGTRCRNYLFSMSLNPPAGAHVETEVFERVADRIAEKLGLSHQPRAIVFHEKDGRRHAHVVWSRIEVEQMRSINLPHYKSKLRDVSRDIFLDQGWDMPRGLMHSRLRDPLDLHRFRSGLLRAILAIKEIGYGSDTQRRVQAGCSSHCAHQWPDTASGCV
jgi:Relaxase/Mobilisation nuclease domain